MNPINSDIFSVAPIKFFKEKKEIQDEAATGFFFRLNGFYFITNHHVVIDEDFSPDELRLLLHKKDDRRTGMFPIPLYDATGNRLWLEHPRYGKDVDVIALPVDIEKLHKYAFAYFCPGDIMRPEIDLSIGDDVLVIGYPLGVRDTIHNLPIVRNATIASLYTVPFEGKPRFLIDSRLHRGTSGSPVITKPTEIIRTTDGSVTQQFGIFRRFFLGIHSETYDIPTRDPDFDEPLGLNYVWYAQLVPEIIRANMH
jgi:hypothetical protein